MRMDVDIKALMDDGLRRLKGLRREEAIKLAIWAVVPVITLSLLIGVYSQYSRTKRLAGTKKADMERFAVLRSEYIVEKARIDELSRKASVPDGSVVSVVESLAQGIGVRGRVVSLKPLGESAAAGYVQREAEVRMEKVDLNQLVNFLFQAENGRHLIAVREFSMKSRFEDPDLFDATLRLAQITRAPS